MKPIWAQRRTRCSKCGEEIPPQSKRVDDFLYLSLDGSYRNIRVHYHLSCIIRKFEDWFEKNTYQPIQSKGKQPVLNITPEQSRERNKVRSRITTLHRYYTQIKPISQDDGQRIVRFNIVIIKALRELVDLGGIPKKYIEQGYTKEVVVERYNQLIAKEKEIKQISLGEE